jgi:hypothetical protein
MQRWIIAASLLAAPACQMANEPNSGSTTTTQEDLTGDCIPVGNYCNATAGAPIPWSGAPPAKPSSTGMYILLYDSQAGLWTAYLAEWGSGKIPVSYSFKDSLLGQFMAYVGTEGEVDVVRTPVIPPVRHLPPFVLELAYRAAQAPDSALNAVSVCK